MNTNTKSVLVAIYFLCCLLPLAAVGDSKRDGDFSKFAKLAVARICDDSVPLKKKLALLEFFQRTDRRFTNEDAEVVLKYFKSQPKVCSEAFMIAVFAELKDSKVLTPKFLGEMFEIVLEPDGNPEFQALLFVEIGYRTGWEGFTCPKPKTGKFASALKTLESLDFGMMKPDRKELELIALCELKPSISPYLCEYCPSWFPIDVFGGNARFKAFNDLLLREVLKSRPKQRLAYLKMITNGAMGIVNGKMDNCAGAVSDYCYFITPKELARLVSVSLKYARSSWRDMDAFDREKALCALDAAVARGFDNLAAFERWWGKDRESFDVLGEIISRALAGKMTEAECDIATQYIFEFEDLGLLKDRVPPARLKEVEEFLFDKKVPCYKDSLRQDVFDMLHDLYVAAGGDEDREIPKEFDIDDEQLDKLMANIDEAFRKHLIIIPPQELDKILAKLLSESDNSGFLSVCRDLDIQLGENRLEKLVDYFPESIPPKYTLALGRFLVASVDKKGTLVGKLSSSLSKCALNALSGYPKGTWPAGGVVALADLWRSSLPEKSDKPDNVLERMAGSFLKTMKGDRSDTLFAAFFTPPKTKEPVKGKNSAPDSIEVPDSYGKLLRVFAVHCKTEKYKDGYIHFIVERIISGKPDVQSRALCFLAGNIDLARRAAGNGSDKRALAADLLSILEAKGLRKKDREIISTELAKLVGQDFGADLEAWKKAVEAMPGK